MADILNDGSVVAGSRDVTINGVLYTATNWNWDEESLVIERKDKNGKVSGRKIVVVGSTGTATLQLATTSTAMPVRRVAFTTTDLDGNSISAYLTKCGRAETNGGETTVPVSFCAAATNSITTS